MTTITIQVPDKFKKIVANKNNLNRITSFLVDDYLTEIYQDSVTKSELENNTYDLELNNNLKKVLGI